MGRVVVFKARPVKTLDRFYVYIPKEWSPEIKRIYDERKKLIVAIEIPEDDAESKRGEKP